MLHVSIVRRRSRQAARRKSPSAPAHDLQETNPPLHLQHPIPLPGAAVHLHILYNHGTAARTIARTHKPHGDTVATPPERVLI